MDSEDQLEQSADKGGISQEKLPESPRVPRSDLDCRELLVRYRNGERDVFAEIVSRYRRPIYSYLVRSGVPPSLRDDVFQEVFAKIHSACSAYNESLPLTPWVFTILVNTVRSTFRKTKADLIELDERLVNGVDHSPIEHLDGSHYTQANETRRWIEGQLQRLPLDQREAIILCCIDNVDQGEAAQMLQIPLGTLKTNLRRARLKLTEALQRRNRMIEREEAQ